MRDGRLGEVEKRDQLTDADLAGVLAKHIDELHPHRIAERLRDDAHPLRLGALDVGVNTRLATRLAVGALGFRSKLQIDGHLYGSISIEKTLVNGVVCGPMPDVLF